MKLSFLKTVMAGKMIYQAGTEHEVEDRHAAEVYVACGEARPVDPQEAGDLRSTLGKSKVQSPKSKV
jgi:hypothetical protein